MHKYLFFAVLRKSLRSLAAFSLAAVLLVSLCACSSDASEPEATSPSPSATEIPTQAPSPTPTPTPSPTPTPTPTQAASPTPAPSFGPLSTATDGTYQYPQAIADKTEVMTGDPVYFKIVTSDKVTKVQTLIDGVGGKTYTQYTVENNFRIWQTRVSFTTGGTRKVQFKCYTASGGSVYVPNNPIKISVTFKYTADSTSKTITSGKTVTFTLKTPSSITSINAVIDGVKQNIKYTDPSSDNVGVKTWKINITFFNLGTRAVQFEAYAGSSLKSTFPDTGIPIIVQASV